MDKNLNTNVLVAARDEYTYQLCYYLNPLIDEGFQSMYKDALEQTRSKDPRKVSVLRNFQIFCKEIPKWNETLLSNETNRIKEECPFLMELLTAVFISNVKILASVKLRGKNSNIKVKIPTTNIFIHKIYTDCARYFYYEPHYYQKSSSFGKNENKRKMRIEEIDQLIKTTLSNIIPVDKVLQETLNPENSSEESGSEESGSEESGSEESGSDGGESYTPSGDENDEEGDDEGDDEGDEVGDEAGDEVGDEVGDEAGDEAGDEVGDEVGDEAGDDDDDESNDEAGDDEEKDISLNPEPKHEQRLLTAINPDSQINNEPNEDFDNPLKNNFGIKNEDTSYRRRTNLPQYSNVPQNNTEEKSRKENFEFL